MAETAQRPPVPDPPELKPREFKWPILTAGEIEALDAGPRGPQWIGPQEGRWQFRTVRQPQQVKDLAIQGFADEFMGQLQRYGVTGADRRHVAKLYERLEAALRGAG
jgi:hypothetical protein